MTISSQFRPSRVRPAGYNDMETNETASSPLITPRLHIRGSQRDEGAGGFFTPMKKNIDWNIDHLRPKKGADEYNRKLALTAQQYRQKTGRESSKYKGVSWNRKMCRWIAQIRVPGERIQRRIGQFQSEEDAARAYNVAAVAVHGPDAFQNTIDAQSERGQHGR